jgi:aminoglycoside 6'-N-acetyltransferase
MELVGSLVVLRPPRAEDVEDLIRVFSEPEVADWWGHFDRDRIERELLNEKDEDTTVYVIEVEGKVVGVIQSYEEPDPQYRQAGIDIAIDTTWQGQGIGADAIRTLARYLLEQRGHHRLTIDPAAANARAIACYVRVGFRPVGVLRQNEQGPDGTFHDSLLMDLVAGELT